MVRILSGVPPEHVVEGVQNPALPVDESEDVGDVRLAQRLEHRMVDRFAGGQSLERPADVPPVFFDPEVFVLARFYAPVDLDQLFFQFPFQFRQMLPDRRFEDGRTGFGDQFFLVSTP